MAELQNVAGAVNTAANDISRLQGIAQANSAFNAEQARLQREWTEQQSAKAMQFNAAEAAKNRDWQEMMSNSAHQREVKDLMAAGLNPVLSAMNGNGASVTSGATASGVVGSGSKGDADTSFSGAMANLLGSMLSAQTALQSANINARTQEAVADKYNAMSEIVANINADASKYAADRSDLRSTISLVKDLSENRNVSGAVNSAVDKAKDTVSGVVDKVASSEAAKDVKNWWSNSLLKSGFDKAKSYFGFG